MLFGPRRSKSLEYNIEPKTEAEKVLHEAVRGRLREIIDQPMTARSLTELEQMATYGRTLLIIGKAPGKVLPGGSSILDNVPIVSDEILGSGLGYDSEMGGAMSPAPQTETFGAVAIRELLSAFNKMTEKKDEPVDLVQAIVAAKAAGLNNLAVRIEERLMGASSAPAKKILDNAQGVAVAVVEEPQKEVA